MSSFPFVRRKRPARIVATRPHRPTRTPPRGQRPPAPALPLRPSRWRSAGPGGLCEEAACRARVGHLEVPRGHAEPVVASDGWPEDVQLGVWMTTTRSRKAKLPPQRIAALDALAMRWT
ncbi:helicase associated domain-containing protein [Embleya sp. NPDC050493]|uniref:helicase associated domain-containing protein n=1 Tax=Embleya sp. NPDC050493 TaxID=3363989 RepID=UPI00378A4FD9